MKDHHPYDDPNNWPVSKRVLAAVRMYFEARALMHRCRALDLQIRNRPRLSAAVVIASARADAFALTAENAANTNTSHS